MNSLQPYQIDFQGRWTVEQRRIVTEAIMQVELRTNVVAKAGTDQPVQWICQFHDDPAPVFIAHHLRKNVVLHAPTAVALARDIRASGENPKAARK